MNLKWSDENLKASALRFLTRTAWARSDNRAYNAAQSRGIIDVCCAHMAVQPNWTLEAVTLDAAKYESVKAWRDNSPSAYAIASKRGWLALVSESLIRERVRLSDDDIALSASKFNSRSAWEKGDAKAYSVAKTRGLIDQVCAHMDVLWKPLSTSEFVAKAKAIYGDEFDYSKVEYVRSNSKVQIICRKHGVFEVTPNNHVSGEGSKCPKCVGFGPSKYEDALFNYVKSLCEDAVQSERSVLGNRQELDVVIHSKKIAIEFNGLIWHSSKYDKGRNYHQRKTDDAEAAGYRLIHIWADEWRGKREWCEAFLRMQLCGPDRKLYARKCELRFIDSAEACLFHDTYHLQGRRGGEHVGLYFGSELVAVATAQGKELARWTVKFGIVIAGGLSRAMKMFGRPLFSYCDKAKHTGRGYLAAGFSKAGVSRPSYWYSNGSSRINRIQMQKHKLLAMGGIGETEKELAESLGFYQIGGCEQLKFVFNQ